VQLKQNSMKKVFSALCAIVMITMMTHAKPEPITGTNAATKTTAKSITVAPKPETKPAGSTAATVKPLTKKTVVTTTSNAKLKADGTPDKRFKENKVAKVSSGPKKADGTPDMRYKANQAVAKKSTK